MLLKNKPIFRRCRINKFIRTNQYIRASEVRVIGPDSEQLGVVLLKRALELAKESELDLVEIAPTAKPPVCRIMDFSKYKYDQEKKERRERRTQKVTHLKQIRVKPHIDDHDYEVKVKKIISFLDKKDKVKINLMFRGREMAFKEQGKELLKKFITDTANHAQIEKSLDMQGRVMSIVLAPKGSKS